MVLMFATGNAGKVREAGDICESLGKIYGIDIKIVPMPDKVDIPETGDTYAENSLQKARYVWERYGVDCIADDSGLEVEALGGAPGIYTARYCDHNFADGIDKLLFELKRLGADTPEQRKGSFECCITLILDGKPHQFHGHCPGKINADRCGSFGFGFDPVFIADATPGFCMAELSEQKKNLVSHRALAMDEMFKWMEENKIR